MGSSGGDGGDGSGGGGSGYTPMSEKEEEEEALRSRRRGKESVARRRGRWSNREIRAAVKDDGAYDRKYSFPQALFTQPPRS